CAPLMVGLKTKAFISWRRRMAGCGYAPIPWIEGSRNDLGGLENPMSKQLLRLSLLSVLVCLLAWGWQSANPRNTAAQEGIAPITRVREAYGKLPLQFEPNVGQTDRRVKYLSRGGGYELFLTSREVVMLLRNEGQGSGVKGQESS